jgi:hypothetical protein
MDNIPKEYVDKNSIYSISEEIVNDIVDDILCRCGIGNEFECVDEDTQKEIKETWKQIIINKLK